jgi:hypothetical protein
MRDERMIKPFGTCLLLAIYCDLTFWTLYNKLSHVALAFPLLFRRGQCAGFVPKILLSGTLAVYWANPSKTI